jgi:hypothetical protein
MRCERIPAHIPSLMFNASRQRDLKGDALPLPLSRIEDRIQRTRNDGAMDIVRPAGPTEWVGRLVKEWGPQAKGKKSMMSTTSHDFETKFFSSKSSWARIQLIDLSRLHLLTTPLSPLCPAQECLSNRLHRASQQSVQATHYAQPASCEPSAPLWPSLPVSALMRGLLQSGNTAP